MKRKYFVVILSICWLVSTCYGQNKTELVTFFGPNITNVHDFWFGERVFYAFPERPFYKVNLHGGVGIESPIFNKNSLKGRIAISYERRGSSASGFNKNTENYGDFINLPVSLMYRPLAEKEISFEIGTSFNYLINNHNLLGREFRSFEIPIVLGIEVRLFNNVYFGTRWMEPINFLKGNIQSLEPNQANVNWKQKTQSFQFSGIYKFKKQ